MAGQGSPAASLVDALVGPEPVWIERAALRRLPHPAARLREMAAVVEAALVEEGLEFGEVDGEALRVDPPRTHLAEPRRVHDIASCCHRYDQRSAGGVLPGVPLRADLANAEDPA